MRISASFDPSHRYGCKLQQCTRTVREADFVIPSGLSTPYLTLTFGVVTRFPKSYPKARLKSESLHQMSNHFNA